MHEGRILKNKILGAGYSIPKFATVLGMTRQNLNVHVAKERLGEDFKRLVKEKANHIFHLENDDSGAGKNNELSLQVIADLVINQKGLIGNITTLTNTNNSLVNEKLLLNKTNSGASQKNPPALPSIPVEFRESLIKFGNGKLWKSRRQALITINNLLHGQQANTV